MVRFRMVFMKQCPECHTEYDDSTNFCAQDGKSLTGKVLTRSRLCPHCANGIPESATKCPYCRADLEPAAAPQWPTREEQPAAAKPVPRAPRVSALSKIMLVAGVAALAAGVYLMATPRGRSESQAMLEEKIKELQEKEQKIQTLESEAAKTRQTLTEQSGRLSELKNKLEESQKELASARVRLGLATREVDRLASSRSQPAAPPASRPPDPVPQPLPAPSRRAAEPGIYEAIRTTQVHEDPSGSSRVLSKIAAGTRVNVVRSVGDWLEVRSKQGNPPGFVRWDDVRFVSRAN
jgi:hypothetical protein